MLEERLVKRLISLDALAVDPGARALPVTVLGPRIANRCRRFRIDTLEDIERGAPRIRREAVAAVRRLPHDVMLRACTSWEELATRALERLTPRQALVVRRRLGLDGTPATLREIAGDLGVTH